jgi:hypothetical protein
MEKQHLMCISVSLFSQIYEGDSNETHSGIVLGKGVEAVKYSPHRY